MADESVRRRFDAAAAEWDSNPSRVRLARAVAEAVRRAVPLNPEMRVLDVGAGTGLVALGLLPDVAEVTALDTSAEMVRVLAQKALELGASNLHARQADIAEGTLPDGRYDLIVSSMALHHMPDVPLVLRKLRPALRPGGWLAIADLETEDGSFHADKTGVSHFGFEKEELQRGLEACGLSEVSCREAFRFERPGADGAPHAYAVLLAVGRADAQQ